MLCVFPYLQRRAALLPQWYTERNRCFGGVLSLCARRGGGHMDAVSPFGTPRSVRAALLPQWRVCAAAVGTRMRCALLGLQAPCALHCGPGGVTCVSRGGQQTEMRAARDIYGVRRKGLKLVPPSNMFM